MEEKKNNHLVEIESNGVNRSIVTLDGTDLSDVINEIRFIHKGGEMPVIEMKLLNCDVKIKSPQIPQLPEILREFYKPIE